MFDQGLPKGLKAFAEREFAGEKLLWAARPDRRIHALMAFGIWIFAIPWTAFALFWESAVAGPLILDLLGYDVGGTRPSGSMGHFMMWGMGLFGIPFILVGFGMLLAPFFAVLKGRRTLYVLTDRRIAIVEGSRNFSIESISPREIAGLSRKEGPDGRGTLILDLGWRKDSDGDQVAKKTELGVIDGVRRVEDMVRAFMDRAAR
jgi:hypothetical protein